MTSLEIEVAVTDLFDIRRHLIVPNVSWGLGLHECDLLIVTKSGYASEIEIKVSRYDLKKDLTKYHCHRSNLIRRLFFAIPKSLLEFQNFIPERAGIIIAKDIGYGTVQCQIVRAAQLNKAARPLTEQQITHLGRLASMRIWSLKRTILTRKEEMVII